MTVSGSTCTRKLIDRTLICNAILYHFQITLTCGRFNRQIIPLTLFLLSRPLEELEFIRLSNLIAEICFAPVTRPQRFILPRKLQSRYRRHLFNFKPLFQITCARGSLNQLSRFTIHSVQEFHIRRIQTRKNMCLKQISPLFTIKLHTSLAPVRLFCSHVCAIDDAGGDEEAPRIINALLLFLKFLWGKNGFTKKRHESALRRSPT